MFKILNFPSDYSKQHALKTYWEVETYLHCFLTF